MNALKLLSPFFIIIPSLALADSISIQGMSCTGCEKQVRKAICMDQEMSSWFETCDAKVSDSTKQVGELRYTLKKGTNLNQDKMTKITKAIEETGRFVIKTETEKK